MARNEQRQGASVAQALVVLGIVGVVLVGGALLAAPGGSSVAIEYGRSGGPMLSGPLGTLNTWSVSVDAAVDAGTTSITGSGDDGYLSVYCENNSTRPVYYGGSQTTSSNAPAVCTDTATCLRSSFSMDVRKGQLVADAVDGGTVTLKCIGGR
ncbi:MAG: hypothetical protein VW362_03455 [Candidatus Nanopelagicales bacterium]